MRTPRNEIKPSRMAAFGLIKSRSPLNIDPAVRERQFRKKSELTICVMLDSLKFLPLGPAQTRPTVGRNCPARPATICLPHAAPGFSPNGVSSPKSDGRCWQAPYTCYYLKRPDLPQSMRRIAGYNGHASSSWKALFARTARMNIRSRRLHNLPVTWFRIYATGETLDRTMLYIFEL